VPLQQNFKTEEHETHTFCNVQRSFVYCQRSITQHGRSRAKLAVESRAHDRAFRSGGGTDIQARLLSKKFQESTSQTFIVDNRPTANGMLGAELAAKSPPDGYTILFMSAALAVTRS
jgi:hypothetical protein